MTRILLCGCGGRMGHVLSECAKGRPGCTVAAGVDVRPGEAAGYPVFSQISEVTEEADVLVDFSHPSLLSSILEYAKGKKLPCVLCTTGYSKEQVEEIKAASRELPIFYSWNMSLGINLLIALAQKAAAVLGSDFDVEIVEKHHNQKIDAPSGTALMLADGIASVMDGEAHYVYDRHSQRKKREKNEIGIHSIRGGTIVGDHEIIFAGPYETVTLSHSAQSKEIFANGALNAAAFLAGKPAGLYSMSDLLNKEEANK